VRLSREDRIAGLPAASARELMRRFRSAQPEGVISEWIEPDKRTDATLARELAQRACCESMSRICVNGQAWWETTTKGNALAQASFGKPITRATAARHLAAVRSGSRSCWSTDCSARRSCHRRRSVGCGC
jgi:hypothetical protein